MSQRLTFLLKEGFGGLIRARFAGFIATTTVAISLILIGLFLIITTNLGRLIENLRSRVELEVFLDDSMNEQKIQELSSKIMRFEGVDSLTFISKDAAIIEFKNLFQEQKNDYFEILGYNPLPASFRIQLIESYRNAAGAEKVYNYISSFSEINEDDVIYRREYLITIEKYINIAIAIDFIVGAIVCLSALLLVSNNIRLIILSKKKLIEIMKLVGATRFFIRMPLYIQGITQGFFGGIFSALFLYGLIHLLALEIPGYLNVDVRLYVFLANLGIILGFTGSYLAIRKYL